MFRNRHRTSIISTALAGVTALGFGAFGRYHGPLLAPDGGADGGAGGGGSGGGGSSNGGGQGGGSGAGSDDTISRSEFTKVVTQRDKAKNEAKAQRSLMANILGVEADTLEIVETGDANNPFKIQGPGVDDAIKLITDARAAKPKKPDERERELKEAYDRRLKTVQDDLNGQIATEKQTSGKKIAGLTNFITSETVDGPLVAACAAENAIDSDESGKYPEIVQLLKPRIKVTVNQDDEGKVTVEVRPLNEDGTEMTDAKTGKPATIRQLVASFLIKKPFFKSSKFRNGPGAGGHGGGQGGGNSPASGANKAVEVLYGKVANA